VLLFYLLSIEKDEIKEVISFLYTLSTSSSSSPLTNTSQKSIIKEISSLSKKCVEKLQNLVTCAESYNFGSADKILNEEKKKRFVYVCVDIYM
jgi:galactose-1-phosphate uridylyltransferase